VHQLVWFRAPLVLGGDSRPVLEALGLDRLADAPRFQRSDVRALGADVMETYLLQPRVL
jgi:diaminohydroxyphosphoribosylaminopyrimidine deaminase / 5-amino-6-(5-phosphoribosylamino)uracil reductase